MYVSAADINNYLRSLLQSLNIDKKIKNLHMQVISLKSLYVFWHFP